MADARTKLPTPEEVAREFAEALYPRLRSVEDPMAGQVRLAARIRARDAAVRTEALRDAHLAAREVVRDLLRHIDADCGELQHQHSEECGTLDGSACDCGWDDLLRRVREVAQ